MKLRTVLNTENEIVGYSFYCPGCKHHHNYWTKEFFDQSVWSFNGDLNNPTFSPSLLNTWPGESKRCHLFIKNGNIEFCGDCTHEYAGKTIALTVIE